MRGVIKLLMEKLVRNQFGNCKEILGYLSHQVSRLWDRMFVLWCLGLVCCPEMPFDILLVNDFGICYCSSVYHCDRSCCQLIFHLV